MRSEDAIAPCSMLYFSERSWIGRKKRRAYWKNAAIAPTVSVPPADLAAAIHDDERERHRREKLDDREEERVVA